MADANAPNAEVLNNQPLGPPRFDDGRRGVATMARFTEVKHGFTAGADTPYLHEQPPIDGTVQVYVPDTSASVSRLFMFCVEMFEAVDDDDWQQILAIYSSAICSVFPGMLGTVRDTFRQLGLEMESVRLPSDAARLGLIFPARGHLPTVMVMMGQLCLIPFKNITPMNYERFLRGRAQGIKSHIGCVSDANVFRYLTMAKALTIRRGFGCILSFKRDLLLAIDRIAGNPGSVSQMCEYLLVIIAWTDMSALVFINEMLLMTNSPVLTDARVGSEILKLGDAYRAICRHHQPQFFRILGEPHLFHLLNRNNYPLLHAVAATLKSEENESVKQFVPAMAKENQLVKDLCLIHHRAAIRIRTMRYQRDLAYLTANDGEARLEPQNEMRQ